MDGKLHRWKEKAKERRKKIEALKKRVKEIIASRDNWKHKYQCLQKEYNKLLKAEGAKQLNHTQVKHHTYSAEEISLYANLYYLGGCSYRGCIKVIQVLLLSGILEFRQPSPSSIRNWIIKLGYDKVHERSSISKECSHSESDWVLILDESISVGSEKILLLLGVDVGKYKFGQPLNMSQVQVLSIRIKRSWKADEIFPVLEEIESRGYKFKNACSDNGNNLCKALKKKEILQIEDCGHYFGNILERRYKKHEIYLEFSKMRGLFRKQNLLSQYAVFLPPQQRSKGRFMNLWPICKWAYELLEIAKEPKKNGIDEDALAKIEWILDFEDLIRQLYKEQELINQLNKILKHNGLSKKSIKTCKSILKKSGLEEKFTSQFEAYLDNNYQKMGGKGVWLCSSDIIESMFGTFKNRLAKNSAGGLTEGCLSIANYGKYFQPKDVIAPMENTKTIDILKWREENLPISMLRKRAAIFKNTG